MGKYNRPPTPARASHAKCSPATSNVPPAQYEVDSTRERQAVAAQTAKRLEVEAADATTKLQSLEREYAALQAITSQTQVTAAKCEQRVEMLLRSDTSRPSAISASATRRWPTSAIASPSASRNRTTSTPKCSPTARRWQNCS